MIFWHSGTGNTHYVAKKLAELLAQPLSYISESRDYISSEGEKIIWVFPVYSWGIPPVIRRYIRLAQLMPNTEHYMVCTCGDDVGLTHEQWRKLMCAKGYNARGAWSVQMPNNYVVLPGFDVDSIELATEKLGKCEHRIEEVARGIKCGAKVDSVVRGAFPGVKTKVLYPLFVRFLMSPKPFHYTEACISCGKCAKTCPISNIKMRSNHPDWGNDCAMCLGCYHVCPVHAVQYGNRTRHKGQYFLENFKRCKDNV
ncbi:MAG: EFR1 family ferrodoxin [Paramuribaculum sp.]|nr:EFR1 family ferrodoxin [Paramuribaculum sp.]